MTKFAVRETTCHITTVTYLVLVLGIVGVSAAAGGAAERHSAGNQVIPFPVQAGTRSSWSRAFWETEELLNIETQ